LCATIDKEISVKEKEKKKLLMLPVVRWLALAGCWYSCWAAEPDREEAGIAVGQFGFHPLNFRAKAPNKWSKVNSKL
jgi:hypothetical protein